MTVLGVHLATAVAIGGKALLLEGPPGSGKSTLALALIDRGAILIGDDAVQLEECDGALWASPPPNIPGKLELRNVGILDFPITSAPVALVLQLTPDAPRHIEAAGQVVMAGLPIPLIALDPAIAAAPLRAEWAMRQYGLAWN